MTPWIALAATLAKEGLPAIAERLKSRPAETARRIAETLATPPAPAAIETALAADPEAFDKLAELDVTLAEMDAADRAQARAIMRDNAWTGPLAMVVVVGFLAFTAGLFFFEIPARNEQILNVAFGFLGGAGFSAVLGFFFGSSIGSKIKTEATLLDRSGLR